MPIELKALKPKETDFEPCTLGEHLRRRRLELGLTQKQAAEQLGANAWTVLNWEKGHTKPPIESMPIIVQFLGYAPFPEPKNLAEHLLAKRRLMGWTIKDAAYHFGVDEGTWGDWERGNTILFQRHRERIAELLGLPVETVHQKMADQWNRAHSMTFD